MKILYYMHVDWNWIKQRPHFIAESLSINHNVDVVYPISKNRLLLTNNSKKNINKTVGYFRLPHIFRTNKFFAKISDLIIKAQLYFKVNKSDYDLIWITHPEQASLIGKTKKTKILYDCMDDHSAFAEANRALVGKNERFLCERTDFILCSSDALNSLLISKYELNPHKLNVVYNAMSDRFNKHEVAVRSLLSRKKIMYLGTISEWIDFDILYGSLAEYEDLEFHFYGPVTIKKPTHPRIIFHGAIDHTDVSTVLANYSAYIMPFKVTELIRSVDPVKLYEYIFSGGYVFSVYYPEVNRFSKFTNFYNNADELKELINSYIHSPNNLNLASTEERKQFLQMNTWNARVKDIEKYLEDSNDYKK